MQTHQMANTWGGLSRGFTPDARKQPISIVGSVNFFAAVLMISLTATATAQESGHSQTSGKTPVSQGSSDDHIPDAMDPATARKSMKVAPGFRVDLVAHEPVSYTHLTLPTKA